MLVIGIDPGLTGAMALVSHAGFLSVADLPTCPNGLSSGKMMRWLDPKGVSEIISGWATKFDFGKESVHAVIERPIAMPGQQISTAASNFDSLGALRAAVTICGYPLMMVSPREWKTAYGLGTDKNEARKTALNLYPDAPITLAKHHNRAESILIARFALRKLF